MPRIKKKMVILLGTMPGGADDVTKGAVVVGAA